MNVPTAYKSNLSEVTKLPGFESMPVRRYDWKGKEPEALPEINDTYVFYDPDLVEVFNGWSQLGSGDGFYLWGPTGAGKSSFVRQWCALMGIPLEEVNGHRRMMLHDHVGQFVVEKDGMIYVYGPLARALKNGSWFLLNEMDQLDPSVLVALNTVLDGVAMVITENGGEIIKPHPDFRFIATGNTDGSGDISGNYQGATKQNMAFMDRFWVMEADYPPADVELDILKRAVPEVPEEVSSKLITIANQVRSAVKGKAVEKVDPGSINVTFSTRTLIRWATNIGAFTSYGAAKSETMAIVRRGLYVSLLNRANEDARQAIDGLFSAEFGHEFTVA